MQRSPGPLLRQPVPGCGLTIPSSVVRDRTRLQVVHDLVQDLRLLARRPADARRVRHDDQRHPHRDQKAGGIPAGIQADAWSRLQTKAEWELGMPPMPTNKRKLIL